MLAIMAVWRVARMCLDIGDCSNAFAIEKESGDFPHWEEGLMEIGRVSNRRSDRLTKLCYYLY